MIPADCNQRYQILNCPLINIQTLASTWAPRLLNLQSDENDNVIQNEIKFQKKYEDPFLQPEQYVLSQVFM